MIRSEKLNTRNNIREKLRMVFLGIFYNVNRAFLMFGLEASLVMIRINCSNDLDRRRKKTRHFVIAD
jgi:hypothetical protein